MATVCVIFDLDGTHVDSEFQSNQAFLDLLPELGEPVERLIKRYRGTRLAPFLLDLESHLGRRLPESFQAACLSNSNELHWKRFDGFGKHVDEAFSSNLLGAIKPDDDTFRLVLNLLNVEPGDWSLEAG